MRRGNVWVLVIAIVLAACGNTPVPTVTPNPSPSQSAVASAAPSPAPSASRTPAVTPAGTAGVYVSADLEVLHSGDSGTFTLDAWLSGTELPIARATVDFGDGSAPVSAKGSCPAGGSTLKLDHVYATSGRYAVRATSADLCGPTTALLDLSTATRVLVLPSATAATAAWPTCSTHQLHMTGLDIGAGLGHVGVLFRLQNVSSRGCNLFGYPGIQLVSPLGVELPTDVHHATEATAGDYLFPAINPHRVSLAPEEYAAFDLGYLDNPSGPAADQPYAIACPTARSIRIVLPKTHVFGTASITLSPCNGWVDVSAIVPGREWIGFQ